MQKDNEYKTVCNKCYRPTWYETEQPCKQTVQQHYHVNGHCASRTVKCTGTLKVIDTSMLDPKLERFYKSGERVEVTYTDGAKERFYVGKSTGWKPVYLEIKRRDSHGGGMIMLNDEAVQSIRGTGVYK